MADKDKEEASFLGGMLRFAKTSGAVTGIATRVAGQKFLGIEGDKEARAEDLKKMLGNLKGPMMKVAQILATVPDALPEEYTNQLAELQSNAPAMGRSFVKRRMNGELGPDWESKYAEFSYEAFAAASLGQVHAAKLHDGRDVVCKLQYPDMAGVVESDIRQLKLILGLYSRIDNTIRHDEILKEIAGHLREELDYKLEAAHMRLYSYVLRDLPGIKVPVPVPELSTKRLLTMTRLGGQHILKSIKEGMPVEVRKKLARELFRGWYLPLYHYGVIHGDPHLGNYLIDEDRVNLLDFGAVRIFNPHFIKGVVDLYEAVRDKDKDKACFAYETWGFKDLTKEKLDILNIWAHFLFAPLVDDRARKISEGDTAEWKEVAGDVYSRLKKNGGITPPREFVFMDRAALGLGGVFIRLDVELNWAEMFRELVEGFDENVLAQRQAEALKIAGLPLTEEEI